jgi:hypothetical protein
MAIVRILNTCISRKHVSMGMLIGLERERIEKNECLFPAKEFTISVRTETDGEIRVSVRNKRRDVYFMCRIINERRTKIMCKYFPFFSLRICCSFLVLIFNKNYENFPTLRFSDIQRHILTTQHHIRIPYTYAIRTIYALTVCINVHHRAYDHIMKMWMWVCIYICMYVCICVKHCVHAYDHIMQMWMWMWVWMCMCMCVNVCACIYLYICKYVCMCVCMYVCLCMHVCMHMTAECGYGCGHGCMCACVCVWMCMWHVYVHVHM